MKIAVPLFVAVILFAFSGQSFAVPLPCKGVASANGAYLYLPDQTGGAAGIKVIRTSDGANLGKPETLGSFFPYGMVISPDGLRLYVSLQAISKSYVRVYNINPATGVLTVAGLFTSQDGDKYGQIAIDPNGKYLYIAESGIGNIVILDISTTPNSPTLALRTNDSGRLTGKALFGITTNHSGTRLYVGARAAAGNVYVYDITTKTAPAYKAALAGATPGDIMNPTYLEVDTGDKYLFVRVLEDVSPWRDILIYDVKTNAYVTYARKLYLMPSDNAWKHKPSPSGYDVDDDNGFEGMALSPNGWFLFFSHFHGLSASANTYYRGKVYGTPLASIEAGVPIINEGPTFWEQTGGLQSSDCLITTNKQDIYLSYSGGATFKLSDSPITTDANDIPTAPNIITPAVGATNVTGNITWEPAQDDGVLAPLTYTIELSSSEVGDWYHMAYAGAGVTSVPISGVIPDQTYYARVQAYDGRYTSPWDYTGPFRIDPNFVNPPSFVSHYLVASTEAVINWSAVSGAISYEVMYKRTPLDTIWTTVEAKAPWYNTADTNPNIHLTGLNSMATYEVMVRAKSATAQSSWAPSHFFYTLERPWIDVYNPGTKEVYVTWGPEINIGEVAVPLSNHYVLEYSENGGAWTDSGETLNNASFNDAANTSLNILFDKGGAGLVKDATYQLRIRTVDNTGGVSDWAGTDGTATLEFHATRAPWHIGVKNVTTTDATVYWDDAPRTTFGATQYQLSYGTDEAATNGTGSPILISSPTSEYKLTNLASYTTYYAKVRAVYPGGIFSDWTDIKDFFTSPVGAAPSFVSHYLVASHEAVVNWEANPNATAYKIAYKPTTLTTWTSADVSLPADYNPADPNPNYHLTGLTESSTYDVRVLSKSGTYESPWSNTHDFYTLERPWIEFYNPGTREVYVTWGPEINTGEVAVPLSNHYTLEYNENTGGGFGGWTDSGQTLNNSSFADPTNTKLNIKFDKNGAGLVKDATYQLRIRTVDNTGGVSDWAGTDGTATFEFHAVRAPWWVKVKGITTLEATPYWDDIPRSTFGAISYEVSYGTDTNATSGAGSPFTVTATNEMKLTGLASYTTYYVKVRAVYPGGIFSDWTDPFSFNTSSLAMAPAFVTHYSVASHEAVVNWEANLAAASYVIGYKPSASGTWTSIEVTAPWYNASDTNPNYHLTGLTELATYDVRVLSKNGAEESPWSATYNFYTLERPWIDYYNPGTREVYITWGPEINTGEVAVPLSNHYTLEYNENTGGGFGGWTDSGQTLNNSSFADPTNTKLNIKFDKNGAGLTQNATYQLRIRTVDNTGGVSDWAGQTASSTFEIYAVRAPWWIDVRDPNTAAGTAMAFWDAVPMSLPGFTSYTMSYGTNADADNLGTLPPVATSEQQLTGLTPYTTYYIKVRASYGGNLSNWSTIKRFYFMDKSDWISHYNVGFTSAGLTWEGVSLPGVTYEVSYGLDRDADDATWTPTPSNQNYGTLNPPLTANKWYWVKVRAYTTAGGGHVSDWSATDSFYTMPRPNNLTHLNVGATSATATWEGVTSAASYELSYGTSADATGSTASTTEIWTNITSLTTGLTYYMKVRAYDSFGGYSDWSDIDSFVASTEAAITNLTPTSGYPGTTVLIEGSNFGTTVGTVEFNGTAAAPAYWKDNVIAVRVPQGATTGNVVVKKPGAISPAASPMPFTIDSSKLVLDDFEGGTYSYLYNTGITYEMCYSDVHERSNSIKVNYSYVSDPGGGWGGVLPTSDAVPVPEIDLTPYDVITLWVKGDGSTNLATFELVESINAPGNGPTQLRAEVWKYTVPIDLSNSTTWEQVTIDLTTSSFTLDSSWYDLGDHVLELDHIKAYQINYATTNTHTPPPYQYFDYIEAGPGAGGVISNIFITREGDAVGSNIRLTWEATPAGNVDIWTKTGTFETDPLLWTKEFAGVAGTQQIDSTNTVGNGIHKWYKIMLAGATLTTADLTQEVLGKYDYNLVVGSNMISLPIIPFDINRNVVVGNQLTGGTPANGDKIYAYIDGVWGSAYLNASGVWAGALASVEADRGYWIIIDATHTAKTISLVGKTASGDRTITIHSGSNFIGSSYPISVITGSLGLTSTIGFTGGTPATADKIYTYTTGYSSAYLNTSNIWVGTLSSFNCGQGYYVNKQSAGDTIWTYTKQY